MLLPAKGSNSLWEQFACVSLTTGIRGLAKQGLEEVDLRQYGVTPAASSASRKGPTSSRSPQALPLNAYSEVIPQDQEVSLSLDQTVHLPLPGSGP